MIQNNTTTAIKGLMDLTTAQQIPVECYSNFHLQSPNLGMQLNHALWQLFYLLKYFLNTRDFTKNLVTVSGSTVGSELAQFKLISMSKWLCSQSDYWSNVEAAGTRRLCDLLSTSSPLRLNRVINYIPLQVYLIILNRISWFYHKSQYVAFVFLSFYPKKNISMDLKLNYYIHANANK